MNFDTIVLTLVIIFAIFGLLRVFIGPTIWDRLLGFSLFSSKVIVAAILIGQLVDRTFMIDVAIIYGILGFVGTILIARFIERRGDI
ncbi:cation:proton antiporter [Alkalibacterium iburiense]|uniref:Cation:proton antiporter n=1 Tax=Alkalibacterium iburiense TaxID=290589 RepID=A0ABP3GVX9_9LACT